MSCGTKLEGRFYSYHEREELADKLHDEDSGLADKVRRQECLSSSELYEAERILSEFGMSRYHDYMEEPCRCSTEEEGY